MEKLGKICSGMEDLGLGEWEKLGLMFEKYKLHDNIDSKTLDLMNIVLRQYVSEVENQQKFVHKFLCELFPKMYETI